MACPQVPPERYMEAVRVMQPDMFVALADEVRGADDDKQGAAAAACPSLPGIPAAAAS